MQSSSSSYFPLERLVVEVAEGLQCSSMGWRKLEYTRLLFQQHEGEGGVSLKFKDDHKIEIFFITSILITVAWEREVFTS